ncbi:MAG TPA: SDR family NAD(P)-dependent oxidoreductase [Ktedonobacteraceae bacterium]
MSSNTLALITGANKGIGFETTRQLGQQGIHILIGARDTARGEEAVQKLAALNVQATLVGLDVVINHAALIVGRRSSPFSGPHH